MSDQLADDTVSYAGFHDAPIGFGHHTLYAGSKYDEMVSWYATLFSAEVAEGEDLPAADHLIREDVDTIIIQKRDDLVQDESPVRTGVFHIAWSYPSLAELMHVYIHARDRGIRPQSALNTGILLQVYYVDPEGNGVELQVDAHDTSEATQAAQRGGKRDQNMAHWVYDCETIVQRMEAGWSDYDILDHDKYHAANAAGALPGGDQG